MVSRGRISWLKGCKHSQSMSAYTPPRRSTTMYLRSTLFSWLHEAALNS